MKCLVIRIRFLLLAFYTARQNLPQVFSTGKFHLQPTATYLEICRLLNALPSLTPYFTFSLQAQSCFYSINFMCVFIYSFKLNFRGMYVTFVFMALRRVLQRKERGGELNFSFGKPTLNIGFLYKKTGFRYICV